VWGRVWPLADANWFEEQEKFRVLGKREGHW
jgi:hypothetical protein